MDAIAIWLPGHLGGAHRRPRSRSTSCSTASTSASASCSRSSRARSRRDQMMNSVAPFWDGNETWLVLGGGGLLVAFPLAYAVIMPALYLPIIVMLLGARVPRRLLRVPLGRQAQARACGTSRSPGARSSPRSCRASCSAATCRASTSRTRRSPAARSIGRRRSRCLRGRPRRRLRAARRDLAHRQDGGRAAEQARGWAKLLLLVLVFMAHRQPVDAARIRAHRRALVHLAEHLLPVAGAAR